MRISWHIDQKWAKLSKHTRHFVIYQTLVTLKNRLKSTFQPMKVCSKWWSLDVYCVDSECFYALLLKVYMTLWGCTSLLSSFSPFRSFWAFLESKTGQHTQNRAKMGHFGWFWTILGTFWGTLGSFWHGSGVGLSSFWGCFDVIFRVVMGIFGLFFGCFTVFLCILVVYWDFQYKKVKNQTTECIKKCNFRQKWPKNGQNCPKTSTFHLLSLGDVDAAW